MLCIVIIAHPFMFSMVFTLSLQIRYDDEDDEIMVNDQAVERLVIVTQVRS